MKKEEIAIIGIGRFGIEVINNLANIKEKTIIAIDIEKKSIDKIIGVDTAYFGDASDQEFLKSLSLESASVFVIGVGKNIQSSLLIASIVKTLYPKARIIARTVSHQHEQILKQIGVTELVNPERSAARRAAIKVLSPLVSRLSSVSDKIFELDGGVVLVKIAVPEAFFEKQLMSIELPTGINFSLIYRKNTNIFVPSGETVFKKNDQAIIVGKTDDILKVIDKFDIGNVHDKTIAW